MGSGSRDNKVHSATFGRRRADTPKEHQHIARGPELSSVLANRPQPKPAPAHAPVAELIKVIHGKVEDEIFFPPDWKRIVPGDLLVSRSGTKRLILLRDDRNKAFTFIRYSSSREGKPFTLGIETKSCAQFDLSNILYAVRELQDGKQLVHNFILPLPRSIVDNLLSLLEEGTAGRGYAQAYTTLVNDNAQRGKESFLIFANLHPASCTMLNFSTQSQKNSSEIEVRLFVKPCPRHYRSQIILGFSTQDGINPHDKESLRLACYLANRLKR